MIDSILVRLWFYEDTTTTEPFEFYTGGGFVADTMIWAGLIENILIALALIFFSGWAADKLPGGITSK